MAHYNSRRVNNGNGNNPAYRRLSEIIENLERSLGNMYSMTDVTEELFSENLKNLINHVQSEQFKEAKGQDFYNTGVYLLKSCAVYARKKRLEEKARKVFEIYADSHPNLKSLFGKEYFRDILDQKVPPPMDQSPPAAAPEPHNLY